MGRKSQPVSLIAFKGGKHLTKSEFEERQAAEQKIKPKANRIRPPTWLIEPALGEFKRIVKEMKELDVLTNVDVNVLAVYCDAVADYQECAMIIQTEGISMDYTNNDGHTNRVPHPLLSKKKQLSEQIKSMAVELGLTPSARSKLTLPKTPPKVETEFDKRFEGT